MTLSLTQNYSAVVPAANFVQFVATGGSTPYTYAVLPGGAGGLINPTTGAYSAPPSMTAYPATRLYDTIQVTDSLLATATASILVATPIFLVLDILQTQLGIDSSHIFLWDQKTFQPVDSSLYIILSVVNCKPFGNNIYPLSNGSNAQQYVSMYAKIDLDIISRGPAARDQKEFVVLALNSIYSQQQQEANGFYISKIPTPFIDLSNIDGAAIPYRFKISYAIQYVQSLTRSVPYYDQFPTEQIVTNA